MHDERLPLLVEFGIQEPHDPVANENRMREVSVHPLRLRLELLEHVGELEKLGQARPVEEHPVVRVQDRGAATGVVVEGGDRLGVDAPLPAAALDFGGFAHSSHGYPGRVLLRDAGSLQTPPLQYHLRLDRLERRQVGRVDPLGKIPQALPASPPGDRDLADPRQDLEHPWHFVRAVPTARAVALDDARVGELGCRERASGAQPSKDA